MGLIRWNKNVMRKKDDIASLSDFFEDVQEGFKALATRPSGSGLSVSSDEKYIYIAADVPGLTSKDVDVSIDADGVLWIKGEKAVEKKDKERKFYRKSQSTYSYAIPLGHEVDESVEPEASCKNGVMTVTFAKKKGNGGGKKINVVEEK